MPKVAILIGLNPFDEDPIMISRDYCKALELKVFKSTKQVRSLKGQLFFFRLLTVVFMMLFVIGNIQ